MTAGGGGPGAVAGGPAPHIPVLGRSAADLLDIRDGGVYIDATFGAGGYTRAMLAAADCQVIAIDRDRNALALGAGLAAQSHGRLTLVEARFSRLDEVARDAGFAMVDGVVLDLGVSSMQLDTAARGFSFRQDGPLDMRMGGEGASAADVIAKASERDLADIVYLLGEERHSRAVARAVVKARQQSPITTTLALAGIVAAAVRSRPNDIHPATRTFQALRIFVNDELGELAAALILAASLVYNIKFDSTLQAERVGKVRGEIRSERNAIASLKAEWAKRSTPGRIQGLAQRHLHLQPVKPTQFSDLAALPDRPPQAPPLPDPIGAMLANPDMTGSVPAAPPAPR